MQNPPLSFQSSVGAAVYSVPNYSPARTCLHLDIVTQLPKTLHPFRFREIACRKLYTLALQLGCDLGHGALSTFTHSAAPRPAKFWPQTRTDTGSPQTKRPPPPARRAPHQSDAAQTAHNHRSISQVIKR